MHLDAGTEGGAEADAARRSRCRPPRPRRAPRRSPPARGPTASSSTCTKWASAASRTCHVLLRRRPSAGRRPRPRPSARSAGCRRRWRGRSRRPRAARRGRDRSAETSSTQRAAAVRHRLAVRVEEAGAQRGQHARRRRPSSRCRRRRARSVRAPASSGGEQQLTGAVRGGGQRREDARRAAAAGRTPRPSPPRPSSPRSAKAAVTGAPSGPVTSHLAPLEAGRDGRRHRAVAAVGHGQRPRRSHRARPAAVRPSPARRPRRPSAIP